MVLVRDVFHCKFGRGGQVVALMKELFQRESPNAPAGMSDLKILTDISGRYYTVVVESIVESVDAHQKLLHASFQQPGFSEAFARMPELIDSGHREYYTVEA